MEDEVPTKDDQRMKTVGPGRHFVFWLVVAAGLAADLLSKSLIFAQLGFPNERTEWLIDSSWVKFRFYTSMNEGALWGVGQGFTWLFASMSFVAIAGILYWLFFRKAATSLWLTITLGCVTAGTLGNLYDRLGMHGLIHPNRQEVWKAVRDFFHFRFFGTFDWAIFNVADILLVCGAVLLVFQSFTTELENSVEAKTKPDQQPQGV